jgi:hypothetical protein
MELQKMVKAWVLSSATPIMLNASRDRDKSFAAVGIYPGLSLQG